MFVTSVELIRYRGHALGHIVEPYLVLTIPVAWVLHRFTRVRS